MPGLQGWDFQEGASTNRWNFRLPSTVTPDKRMSPYGVCCAAPEHAAACGACGSKSNPNADPCTCTCSGAAASQSRGGNARTSTESLRPRNTLHASGRHGASGGALDGGSARARSAAASASGASNALTAGNAELMERLARVKASAAALRATARLLSTADEGGISLSQEERQEVERYQ